MASVSASRGAARIWVDATGVVRWGAQPCTGVQRVELGLCQHAMAFPDKYGICILDPMTMKFLPVESVELEQIRGALFANGLLAEKPKDFDRLKTLHSILKFGDNETARRLAVSMTGAQRRTGLRYNLAKTGVRLVIWSYAGLRAVAGLGGSLVALLSSERDNENRPAILVSHEVNRGRLIDFALKRSHADEVNIIYDLIPVLTPDLVNRRFSEKMGTLFERIRSKNNFIITISHSTRDDLVAWYRDAGKSFDEDRITTCQLNNPINIDNQELKPISALEGKRFALFCSSVELRKCQWILVDAWEKLAKKHGAEALPDLVLVGREGLAMEKLRAALGRLDAAKEKVHYLGKIEESELRWAYRNCDFTLFPSLSEGWGLGVSEALAYGKTVLHSDIPILHEAAQDLMPSAKAGDVDSWVTAVENLLSDPAALTRYEKQISENYVSGKTDDFARCVMRKIEQAFTNKEASQ